VKFQEFQDNCEIPGISGQLGALFMLFSVLSKRKKKGTSLCLRPKKLAAVIGKKRLRLAVYL